MSYMCGNPLLTTSRSTTEGIATVAQTIILVPGGFVRGMLDVYVGGACLSKGDYDDSSGTQIVLAKSMALGTQYRVVCFNPAGVTGNYVAKSGDTMTGVLTMNAPIYLGQQGTGYSYNIVFDGGVGNRPALNCNSSTKTVYFANAAGNQTNLSIADSGDVGVRGVLSALSGSFGGNINAGSAAFSGGIATNGSYELGNPLAVQTPFIDFHSSGTGNDYDSRIIAGGGNATIGNGYLSYYAMNGHNFTGAISVLQNGATAYSYGLYMKSGGYQPFLRVDNTGQWQFVNSANSAINLSISDNGVVSFPRARPNWAGVTPWDSGNLPSPAQTNGLIYTASHLRTVGGVDTTWNWAGQGGQPSWVWGGSDGANMYVYNPANFTVYSAANATNANYANNAGSVGGVNNPASLNGAQFGGGVSVGSNANLVYANQGLKIVWNDVGTGEGCLVNNQGLGNGGFVFRTVNNNNTAEKGRFTITQEGAGSQGSDVRLKQDIETIDGALDKVCRLRGVSFTWRSTGAKSYGLIAQEAREVFPNVVTRIGGGEHDDYLGLQYAALTAPLVEAVKELKVMLDAALQRIATLEGAA